MNPDPMFDHEGIDEELKNLGPFIGLWHFAKVTAAFLVILAAAVYLIRSCK